MNGDASKDNENPTIYMVDHTFRDVRRTTQLGWQDLDDVLGMAFTKNPRHTFDTVELMPQERALRAAIYDSSIATGGQGVHLLRDVLGMDLPTSRAEMPQNLLIPPGYLPQARNTDLMTMTEEALRMESKQRDVLDAMEIYDMIRTIQDPEHPLTLEQLGVIRPHQITVMDTLDNNNNNNNSTNNNKSKSKSNNKKEGSSSMIEEEEEETKEDPEEAEQRRRLQRKGVQSSVDVRFTPTIPHCSQATIIGLTLRVKLQRSLPLRFRITVRIEPGTHQSEGAINKQIADKERVSAALENKHLLGIVNRCIAAEDVKPH